MLENFSSPYDATVVRLLTEAGAQIVGKANCDEFGMGSLNTYSIHGPVVNPHQALNSTVPWTERERRSAGGSSGGSAAAVRAGLCDTALGTDTGGSVRLPASYCGVVGLKPSYGLISRWGVVSFADSLDCVGILGKSVSSVERVFGVVSKYDPKDPTAATIETRQKASRACIQSMDLWGCGEGSGPLSGLKIGVPQEYFPAELNDKILTPLRTVLDGLKSRGATIVSVNLPSTPYALSAYYVIASAEASSNLARYDGIQYGLRVDPPPGSDTRKVSTVYSHTRSKGFGPEVQRRILLGSYALSADAFDNYFLQAQKVRSLIRSDFDRVFKISSPLTATLRGDISTAHGPAKTLGVDVLLHPSAIRTAPLLPNPDTTGSKESNDLDAYVQDVLTVPASLAGLPAMSVPAGLGEDGWPVGVSVVGQWGCDEMVMSVGKVVEDVTS
ncbi:hypothetical protein NLI96_g4644 [Meripilus lineatus]|uniref:Glutamyl-tRNA(Gln) amidotransferase subunit A, mitochondrial n=1 Tax=Meripilus lineatus TaxID=2056292 RepID=A0AAD5V6E9_9APHY|nr:hypothetical protein NLI96_g4644 [Physisporinus lineatus]